MELLTLYDYKLIFQYCQDDNFKRITINVWNWFEFSQTFQLFELIFVSSHQNCSFSSLYVFLYVLENHKVMWFLSC